MREPLTQTFRAALDAAQQAAREVNDDFVGTDHLAVGVGSVDGEAFRALRAAHADADRLIRAMRRELTGSGADNVTGALPMSPRAQRAINDAIVLAQSNRAPKVTTRFLLSALLQESDSPLRRALRESGADVDTLQAKLADAPERAEA